MMRRAFLCAAAALLLFRADANAQSLSSFINSVAAAWSKGDVEAITALASPDGIAIEVDGVRVGSVSVRQATAVLRRIFDDRKTVRAAAGAAKQIPGSDNRAYTEIVWERRSRGTTESERVNVFVAMERERDRWKITEIRLMQ